MERCPHCNAELPPVAFFCPICGQKLAEKPEAEASPNPRSEPEAGQAAAPPSPSGEPASTGPVWQAPPAPQSTLVAPAFMAGIAAGVLAGVPVIGDFCCLWTLACGALAVFFFRVQFHKSALPHEAGRLGVMSGFFGFAVSLLVSFISHALIRRHPWGMVDYLREEFRQRAAMMNSPNADRILQMVNAPGGGPFLVLAWALTYLLGFLGMSILGALLAGAILRRRD